LDERAISLDTNYQPNSKLDLSFERIVDLPKELIWRAWTEPELIKQWFTPEPWKTIDCEIDLWPGGKFRTVMRSPEGQEFPNVGSYLEVRSNESLVWTNALSPGFRPTEKTDEISGFFFTAMITLSAHTNGTKYTATVIHANETDCYKHAAMGFQEGWGKALDQLVALVKKL
jgi:uncharacterized protein YndB with AHSA1/START domain